MGDIQDGGTTTIASLLRSIGGWTRPTGRGLLMFGMLSQNMAAAALGGVTGAYLTAFAFGPLAAVGFAGGSCIGYVVSTLVYWRTTEGMALKAFDDFPQLMMLHLHHNYRTLGFDRIAMATEKDRLIFRGKLEAELRLRCLLMAAWHTAAPAIEEISIRKEAKVIDKLTDEIE